MQNLYSIWPGGMNEEHNKRSTNRLLKRLRIALLIWLLSFIATVIWFSFSRSGNGRSVRPCFWILFRSRQRSMTINGKVILKKGKEISIRRFHPWIFSGAIHRTEGNVPDGGWVQVVDFKDQTLGFGHYQHGSITVRMLSFLSDVPSENFCVEKIDRKSVV